ncbi:unnamed protein product [Brassica oleracea]|uniref:Uncharacterized protein n=1 Tax=Brassica oleracea TaxID=3712 RepID=A0A3P6FJV2_BRAOL|nr:unnamed protein product [Brassica oleracea]
MDISMLEKFLLEQIKVGGKPGVLSDSVPLRETKERSLLTSPPIPTSPNGTSRFSFRVNSSIWPEIFEKVQSP